MSSSAQITAVASATRRPPNRGCRTTPPAARLQPVVAGLTSADLTGCERVRGKAVRRAKMDACQAPKTYLKACINGARTPEEHPNLPVTPEQLAAEAVAAHRAGARAVHMHPKTADGVDSLQPDIVGAAVEAVRHAAPGLPLGVTTGAWALPDPDERLRAVEAWTVLPDFASVNWHEPGSEPSCPVVAEHGAWRRGRHISRRGGGVVGRVRRWPRTACG